MLAYDEIIDQFIAFLESRKVIDKKSRLKQLKEIIENPNKARATYDEIIDFLDIIYNNPTRWECFGRYIRRNFNSKHYYKVLDVGSGSTYELANYLTKFGYELTCVDPNIDDDCPYEYYKTLFDYRKFDVSDYQLLVGQEPCDGAEHILYSGLTYDIPFMVDLCYATHHRAIHQKRKFKTVDDYFNHLLTIANGKAKIVTVENSGKTNHILRSK